MTGKTVYQRWENRLHDNYIGDLYADDDKPNEPDYETMAADQDGDR